MRTQALERAFRATTYQVETPEGIFSLRIGISNPAFDDFLRRKAVHTWAVITACNPGGVRHDQKNAQRQMQLRDRLQALGWFSLPASTLADDGQWPAEPGFLLLQIGEEEVSPLAAEFSQLAFVCGDRGTAPRLVWIGEEAHGAGGAIGQPGLR